MKTSLSWLLRLDLHILSGPEMDHAVIQTHNQHRAAGIKSGALNSD